MALPPPIPLIPADRPETWEEYQHRRSVLALWRQIGDFVTAHRLSEFLFAPYKAPSGFEPTAVTPPEPLSEADG
jgi:hypothetical protein